MINLMYTLSYKSHPQPINSGQSQMDLFLVFTIFFFLSFFIQIKKVVHKFIMFENLGLTFISLFFFISILSHQILFKLFVLF